MRKILKILVQTRDQNFTHPANNERYSPNKSTDPKKIGKLKFFVALLCKEILEKEKKIEIF